MNQKILLSLAFIFRWYTKCLRTIKKCPYIINMEKKKIYYKVKISIKFQELINSHILTTQARIQTISKLQRMKEIYWSIKHSYSLKFIKKAYHGYSMKFEKIYPDESGQIKINNKNKSGQLRLRISKEYISEVAQLFQKFKITIFKYEQKYSKTERTFQGSYQRQHIISYKDNKYVFILKNIRFSTKKYKNSSPTRPIRAAKINFGMSKISIQLEYFSFLKPSSHQKKAQELLKSNKNESSDNIQT